MQEVRPYVLCIGGFDPSAGAGVLADIKTLEQLKVFGLAVLTCNTIQTENEFMALDWFETENILEAIQRLIQVYPFEYVKIGVVRNSDMLCQIVDELLSVNPQCKIIWDTVLGSTTGYNLFEMDNLEKLKTVLPKLCLVTPNILEYNILNDFGLIDTEGKMAILQKAGHSKQRLGLDILFYKNQIIEIQQGQEKLPQKHGSGCVLASAITGYLSLGNDLESSCKLAKGYINRFLNSNQTLLGYHYE
jgi:hydroxymethylpyrimidine/phosphomethylpyrimidine kinase